MKTESVETLLNTVVDNYTLVIDKITELDPHGIPVLNKLLAYVITPDGEAGAFNYSPYVEVTELHIAAKLWIRLGCPELGNPFAPKWTKESLKTMA